MDKQLEKTVLKRMVIQYHKDGLSIRKITEKMKTSKSNVQLIVKMDRQMPTNHQAHQSKHCEDLVVKLKKHRQQQAKNWQIILMCRKIRYENTSR